MAKDLSPEQLKMIEDLCTALSTEQLSEGERTWLTKGNTYLRYLVANKWNYETSLNKIKATIEWRRENKPNEITYEDVYEEAVTGNIYQNGFCKEGRPIMVVKKRGTLTDPLKQLKLYIYTMEKAIANMKGDVYQMIMIFDVEKLARDNSPPMNVTLELLDVLSRHYPERMYTSFFVYQPWIFNMFYNIVWPFLDDRQRRKLNIVGKDFTKILELVDKEQLEKKYGGEIEDQYPFEKEQTMGELA